MPRTYEVPDQSGKVALITGANTGIGKETARELARAGAHVLLACRSEEKARPVVEEIRQEVGHDRVEFVELDLASLASVRRTAQALLAREDLPIHMLINNAGLVAPGQTEDGFELIFGVCHMGHFLLTELLLDRLIETGTDEAPARIVNVASKAHYQASGLPSAEALRQRTRSTTGMPEYAVAKLANVLHASELARRLEGQPVRAYALHPGVVASDAWRRIPNPFRWLMLRFMLSVEQGAATSLYCATAPELAEDSGLYYDDCHPKKPSPPAHDQELAARLWELSEGWLQESSP